MPSYSKSIILTFILFMGRVEAQTISVKQYIDSFKMIAMQEMLEYKIPASITLAQGLLESGSGNSRLARQGNNHFGIKCKKDWTGCTILEDDDALQECFRCYTKAEDSYRDHSRFLKENRRYANLFTHEISDYKAWARGLLAAGYATNQKYADLLISTIERNRLMQYDSMVLSGFDPYARQIRPNIDIVDNNVPSTVVGPDESLESIALNNQKTEKKLARYNDLSYHRQIEPGDVLYLRPKKRKAGVASHQVENGETMWEISQKYAIRINSLYKKNLMEPGTEPKPGVVLYLQGKAAARPDTGRITASESIKQTVSGHELTHMVNQGETLYGIALKYGITVDELKKLNGLENEQINTGQILIVGRKTQTVNNSVTSHTVQKGETLYSIAKKYGLGVDELKLLNKLSSDSINPGQVLIIR